MIDLAEKMSEPSCPMNDMGKPYYPSVHLTKDKEYPFPDEGTMVVKFKVTSRSENERDGKKTYSCTLELRAIEKIEDKKANKKTDAYAERSEILDRLRDALKEGNPGNPDSDKESEY
jgi:hypothetical protein